ncbi:MAG: lysophospholipid acyltransferase family protein [Elusimicrobia bacterium]|nr:lysophospholipid acyltransferase family protein [Elusimicrobiota bacterium]
MRTLDYYLYLFLERFLGRAAAASVIGSTCLKTLDIPRFRDVIERNFRRIHRHTHGREPTAQETASFRAEMAQAMARQRVGTYELLRDPGRGEVPVTLKLLPAIEGLRRGGRGVVLVSPHFGDFQMLFHGLARAGLPLHAMVNLVRPAMREVTAAQPNLRFTDFSTGAKYYLDALGRNELVLLLADMDFFPGGRTLDFFGAPCNPPHGPARLALAASAPVLPVYAVWRGRRHDLLCDAPIPTAGADQEEVEKSILRSMERFIGRHPGHWLIYHDPWDLPACARQTRRQLRQLRLSRWFDGLWGG